MVGCGNSQHGRVGGDLSFSVLKIARGGARRERGAVHRLCALELRVTMPVQRAQCKNHVGHGFLKLSSLNERHRFVAPLRHGYAAMIHVGLSDEKARLLRMECRENLTPAVVRVDVAICQEDAEEIALTDMPLKHIDALKVVQVQPDAATGHHELKHRLDRGHLLQGSVLLE